MERITSIAPEIRPEVGHPFVKPWRWQGAGVEHPVGRARFLIGSDDRGQEFTGFETGNGMGQTFFAFAEHHVIRLHRPQYQLRIDRGRGSSQDDADSRPGPPRFRDQGCRLPQVTLKAVEITVVEIADADGEVVGRPPGKHAAERAMLRCGLRQIDKTHVVSCGPGGTGHKSQTQRRDPVRAHGLVGVEK